MEDNTERKEGRTIELRGSSEGKGRKVERRE